jgi:hypothetical protein
MARRMLNQPFQIPFCCEQGLINEPALALKHWTLYYVQPRFEKNTAADLGQQNIECYVPLFRRSNGHRTIELPLFPGYVFCALTGRHVRVPRDLLRVESVDSLQVSRDVAALKDLTGSGSTYGPWAYMDHGHRMVVQGGPLDGLVGMVEGKRLVIPIRSVLRSVIVEIDKTCRIVSSDYDQDICGPNRGV